MAHRDRVGDPSGQGAGQGAGRRGAAGDVGHRQGFPTPQGSPLPVRPRDRNGGFPRLSGPGAGSVPRGSRCPASPRHAPLAENLGTPSLWVNISAPWY